MLQNQPTLNVALSTPEYCYTEPRPNRLRLTALCLASLSYADTLFDYHHPPTNFTYKCDFKKPCNKLSDC